MLPYNKAFQFAPAYGLRRTAKSCDFPSTTLQDSLCGKYGVKPDIPSEAEIADHQRFTLDTGIKVYFCDPQSPWQRGSNKNTNGLLRQYFPKGMELSNVHQNPLNAVARRLNERPSKTLEYRTPAERFDNRP